MAKNGIVHTGGEQCYSISACVKRRVQFTREPQPNTAAAVPLSKPEKEKAATGGCSTSRRPNDVGHGRAGRRLYCRKRWRQVTSKRETTSAVVPGGVASPVQPRYTS